MASGQIVEPFCGSTRTEADFLSHVQAVVASDPRIQRWHIVSDNLNTHCSESMVSLVAAESGLDIDLGIKGKSGILKNLQSRAVFLGEPSHKIVFHYTPSIPQACLVDKPGGNLVEHSGKNAGQTGHFRFMGSITLTPSAELRGTASVRRGIPC